MMNEWIKLEDQYPEPDARVEICYTRHSDYTGKDYRIVTLAVWEDGKIHSDSSNYIGNGDDWLFEADAEYDEDYGDYFIPKGWYEVLTGTGSEYCCGLECNEVVTHWREIELPEGVMDNE